MRPTTTNLLLVASAALVLTGIGGCVFHFSDRSRNPVQVTLRVFARILMLLGFFLIGTLFWNHVSGALGPKQMWYRAPSFYLVTAFLAASAVWWFRSSGVKGRRLWVVVGYPLLLIALVSSGQLLVEHLQRSASTSLHSGIRSTIGQVAPEIRFLDEHGVAHSLSDFRGKVVLLNFWATTCGPCVREMPELSGLQTKLADRGFILVYLSSESPEILDRFFRERSLAGMNGRLAAEFPTPAFYQSGKAWPISFLIGPSGVVKDAWVGAYPVKWIESQIAREL